MTLSADIKDNKKYIWFANRAVKIRKNDTTMLQIEIKEDFLDEEDFKITEESPYESEDFRKSTFRRFVVIEPKKDIATAKIEENMNKSKELIEKGINRAITA